ncbi:MAG: methylaspartate mutase accessory protein GlmL [Clostridiales bacterium]|nr:methylaspartate mutase accessory protein GlmL [Clostridiales bacterium]
MNPILLIDYGSTNTKVTAVSLAEGRVLGRAAADTTVDAGLDLGLERALHLLRQQCGDLRFETRLACSSAAGGLRMAACGLVPELTGKAAKMACLGAGAKLVKTYSYRMTDEDIAELAGLRPDIFLLTGGTDGGDSACILHNAARLADCECAFPILIAGNRGAAADCERLLQGRETYRCENVMPSLHRTNIAPAQAKIRELFLRRIARVRGLDTVLMPTPAAVMSALELLASRTGDLLAVDLGGATTDVYSMASGAPRHENVILKGLPEPYAKRTVEGDIGMRINAPGIVAAAGLPFAAEAEELAQNPSILPQTPAQCALDATLAAAALEIGLTRHAGSMEEVYTPLGRAYAQTGKDLSDLKTLVLTGGALVHSPDAARIAAGSLRSAQKAGVLCPKRAEILVDRNYILYAAGLLAEREPGAALMIMKKELIQEDGTA